MAAKRRISLAALCALAFAALLLTQGCASAQSAASSSAGSQSAGADSASASIGVASKVNAGAEASASFASSAGSAGSASDDEGHDMTPTSMPIIAAGQRTWTLELEDNPSADALEKLMDAGLALDMAELNGNEKYAYLDEPLPSDPAAVDRIEAGDVMLYGDSCLVVFYRSFDTQYAYTRLGRIRDSGGLADELGNGDVHVELYLEWSE